MTKDGKLGMISESAPSSQTFHYQISVIIESCNRYLRLYSGKYNKMRVGLIRAGRYENNVFYLGAGRLARCGYVEILHKDLNVIVP